MHQTTFTAPDLAGFAGLDDLGLVVDGQCVTAQRAVVACHVAEADQWCHECGCWAVARDTVTRKLAHVPWGWRPTVLEVRVCRYRCGACGRVWRQDTSRAAEPRSKLSRAALRYGLEALVCQHLSVARVAQNLAVSWSTANDAILAEGQRVLISDPARFEGVHVIGVDDSPARFAPSGRYPQCVASYAPGRQVRHRDH